MREGRFRASAGAPSGVQRAFRDVHRLISHPLQIMLIFMAEVMKRKSIAAG